jgi:hypothetical protein
VEEYACLYMFKKNIIQNVNISKMPQDELRLPSGFV